MDAETLGLALGALLSGLGSFLAAVGSIRSQKRKLNDDCEKRIREIERAFQRGMRVERRRKDDTDARTP